MWRPCEARGQRREGNPCVMTSSEACGVEGLEQGDVAGPAGLWLSLSETGTIAMF